MLRVMMLICLALLVQACSSEKDLKSPCVGAEGSPCGPKKHVNDWWLS